MQNANSFPQSQEFSYILTLELYQKYQIKFVKFISNNIKVNIFENLSKTIQNLKNLNTSNYPNIL